MNLLNRLFLFGLITLGHHKLCSQSLVVSNNFSLASPYSEPDGRSDLVKLPNSDFVTLAKNKGSQTGKAVFLLERYDANLKVVWQTPLTAESYEDFKDLFFNGKELVILSVIHLQDVHKTTLEAYGFDVNSGKKLWTKELESYDVKNFQNHDHKGKVKETFVDVICEHVDPDFVTPFEYKHNIQFSQDSSRFISYVYNYGEKVLTASVAIYDKECNLIEKGKVPIDNDFINYGMYVDNKNLLYIFNANKFGRLNVIQYNMTTRAFELIEVPGASQRKDDILVQFIGNGHLLIANTEVEGDRLVGVVVSKLNFAKKQIETSFAFHIDDEFKENVKAERQTAKHLKGDEDWNAFDLVKFELGKKGDIILVLEKRFLFAQGYPHIKKDVFDITHNVEINGHVQTEGIILISFSKEGKLLWKKYLPKNQVYPAVDGLNTISFIMDNSDTEKLKLIYAASEKLDASYHSIRFLEIGKSNGETLKLVDLPNNDKLTPMRDFTFWLDNTTLVLVGKKGLMGKSSSLLKYKF